MERDDAVGEPGDIARQLFSVQRRHADALEQLAADAAGREIHQRRRAHVEGEAVAPVESRAAAWLTVRLEDDGRAATRLQARGSAHASDAHRRRWRRRIGRLSGLGGRGDLA